MRKKTNKAVYALLGFLAIAAALMGVFSIFKRRADFIIEGDSAMAEFCITFGIVLLGIALLSAAVFILLLRRDRQTQFLQESFFAELGKSPVFKTWFLKEEAQIKKQFKAQRSIGVIFSVLLDILIVFMLMLMLVLGVSIALVWVSILFAAVASVLFLQFTDYNKNFIEPMLKSVTFMLPAPAAKDAFADQMRGKQRGQFAYARVPRANPSTAFILPDYCYFRQFRNSRVIINAQIRKIVLYRASYTVGLRIHFRSCYAMELYLDSGNVEKPVWQGYFTRREAVYQALSVLQAIAMPEAEIEDKIKQG